MLILHGENIVLSRQRLVGLLRGFSGEIIRLEGEKLNLTDLKQAIESHSLFGKEKLIVTEKLFSGRPGKEKELLSEYLKETKPENLILWEGKKVDGRVLVSFSFAQIEKFDLAPIVFRFLDSLSPLSKKSSLNLLHQCLRQEAPEMVFYLLCRQIGDLIIARDLGEKGLGNRPLWKKRKSVRQAKNFTPEALLSLYRKLLAIDYGQKTGKTLLPLSSQLDLLIASL